MRVIASMLGLLTRNVLILKGLKKFAKNSGLVLASGVFIYLT